MRKPPRATCLLRGSASFFAKRRQLSPLRRTVVRRRVPAKPHGCRRHHCHLPHRNHQAGDCEGPRRRAAPGMPRGARVLRSQPGLWGGGRGSGPACAPPWRGRECLMCPRQAGTWPASLVLFSMGRVGYCGAMCHGGAHPARGFRHGLLAPFAGDLEGGRSNVTTLSCWHSVLVSVTARSRGGCCSSRPHGTFGERPGGDCTGRSFSCDQQRAGLPSAPPRALWGVALLHPPVRPASQPGVLPSCPSQLLP